MESLLLDNIDQPSDLKNLNKEQVNQLCAEIRQFLLQNISRTGGHLASNLGAVELTVALHRVMTTPMDKIVFDVGHQCYTHKLLTGRRSGFAKLRQLDGISGFPNPNESSTMPLLRGTATQRFRCPSAWPGPRRSGMSRAGWLRSSAMVPLQAAWSTRA